MSLGSEHVMYIVHLIMKGELKGVTIKGKAEKVKEDLTKDKAIEVPILTAGRDDYKPSFFFFFW